MTGFQIVSLVVACLSTIVIPLAVILVRSAIKWTRVESKLDHAIEKLEAIVRDKDATHKVMVQQMTDDRKATDTRLRWLEEHIWKRSNPGGR